MNHILKNGNLSMEIDPQGAYIVSFKSGDGDIFFEKRKINYHNLEKNRGGCHVCLPQFGPSGAYKLKQHGYGRDVAWELIFTNDRYIKLGHLQEEGDWKGLESILEYVLGENCFEAIVSLKNTSSGNLKIAPGFHPYYQMKKDDQLVINGQAYPFDILEKTLYIDNVRNFEINDRKFSVENSNLNLFAIWTDLKGDYVCIEPSYRGDTFIEDRGYLVLRPGDEKRFSFKIKME